MRQVKLNNHKNTFLNLFNGRNFLSLHCSLCWDRHCLADSGFNAFIHFVAKCLCQETSPHKTLLQLRFYIHHQVSVAFIEGCDCFDFNSPSVDRCTLNLRSCLGSFGGSIQIQGWITVRWLLQFSLWWFWTIRLKKSTRLPKNPKLQSPLMVMWY